MVKNDVVMNPFVSWVSISGLSPLFQFVDVFFLQWQFSILSLCAPYLSCHCKHQVTKSIFLYVFLIHHFIHFSYFTVSENLWFITISSFIPPHFILCRLYNFLSQYFPMLFSLHIFCSGYWLRTLSWGFSNSHFFFVVFNPSPYLFQPWTQLSVITLTVASTQGKLSSW